MKKIINTIVVSLIVIIIVCVLVLGLLGNRVHKNDSFVTGNTAGNLYNNGLFCEQGGRVYFSNAYDEGALYSMNPDESDIKKISTVSAKSINVDKERIYYSLSGKSTGKGLGYVRKATGMYSMKKKGGRTIPYTQDPVGIIALCGNNLFYQHYNKTRGTYLDCIGIDKKNNRTILENMVAPASVDAGFLYFAGADKDMYLYSIDALGDTPNLIYEHQMYSPIYQNGYVYYIDLETNYRLRRYSITTGEDVLLADERVDMFNVYSNMIYYQTDSSSPDAALVRMTTDGLDREVVAPGIYCDINITSAYVYFHAFGSDTPVYHTPVFGVSAVRVFEPGIKD